MKTPIPKAVVNRLPLYLRRLEYLAAGGTETISSRELAESLGRKDAQVRKDFACFGNFGRPGVGYPVAELITKLRGILGTDHLWRVALVGFGNLGRALVAYKGFQKRAFKIQAVFDADPAKVGRRAGDLVVQSAAEMVPEIRRLGIPMAILAVPAEVAQAAADRCVEAGVVGILNFAPVTLDLPGHVAVNHVDLTLCMEQLSFLASTLSRRAAGP